MNWLRRLFPHDEHPLYALESARVEWLQTNAPFHALAMIALPAMIMGGFLLAGLAYELRDPLSFGGESFAFAYGAFVLSLTIFSAFFDFTCIFVGLNSISRDRIAQRFDLLVLATTNDQFTQVKHLIAQLFTRRALILYVALRVCIYLFVVLYVLLNDWLVINERLLPLYLDFLLDAPLGTVLFSSLILLGCAFFIIEPFWRARALTALSVAISTRTQQLAVAVPLGLALLAAVWFTQFILIYAYFGIGGGVANVFNRFTPNFPDNFVGEILGALLVVLYLLAFFAVVFLYYRMLERRALAYIRRRIP